jgi:hypothetical protein
MNNSASQNGEAVGNVDHTLESVMEKVAQSSDPNIKVDLKTEWQSQLAEVKFWRGRDFDTLRKDYLRGASYLPRVGEAVLFCTGSGKLTFQPKDLKMGYTTDDDPRDLYPTMRIKLCQEASDETGVLPDWKAGVVSQAPDLDLGLDDLRHCTRQRQYLIDLLADPLKGPLEKEPSTNIYHVSLDHIRPLSTFNETLSGIGQPNWDRTIYYAMKTYCLLAHVEPTVVQQKGQGVAIADCQGVWRGPELWVIGDVVRIHPLTDGPRELQGILQIEGIEVECDFRPNRPDDSCTIYISGNLYTTEKDKACSPEPLSPAELQRLPSSLRGYTFYHLYEPGLGFVRESAKSYLSRLHEKDAVQIMIGDVPFDWGAEGVNAAQMWAGVKLRVDIHDKTRWKLCDDRLNMLGLSKLNGMKLPEDQWPALNGTPLLYSAPDFPDEDDTPVSRAASRAGNQPQPVASEPATPAHGEMSEFLNVGESQTLDASQLQSGQSVGPTNGIDSGVGSGHSRGTSDESGGMYDIPIAKRPRTE